MSHTRTSPSVRKYSSNMRAASGSGSSSAATSTSASPWSNDDNNLTGHRSERQLQLDKLLRALEAKKAHGSHTNNGNPNESSSTSESHAQSAASRASRPHSALQVASQPSQPVEGHTASTRSSAARAAATASAAAAAAGEAAAEAKKRLIQARAGSASSSRSNQSLPLPSSHPDDAAHAYTSHLLESRGRLSAGSHAARGEIAIARGSSVHARGDMHDEMSASEFGPSSSSSSARTAPSHHSSLSTLGSSPNTNGFVVASGTSMEDRALLRAYRKQQIAEAHAATEERKRVDALERERLEHEAIEAAKRAELQRKRDLKRAEREAATAKLRAAELETQKSLLAQLHHQRARLVFFGWAPWRRLIEASHIRMRAMQVHADQQATRRLFRRWIAGKEIAKAQRLEREEQRLAKARRYYLRRKSRHILRQWRRAILRRHKEIEAKRVWYRKTLLRRTFHQLRSACHLSREARARKVQRLESRIEQLSKRVRLRFYIDLWSRAVAETRREKDAARKKQQVKAKVGTWLEEFRRAKALERGELPIATTLLTEPIAALSLDQPSTLKSATTSITPSYVSATPLRLDLEFASKSDTNAAAASRRSPTRLSATSTAESKSPSSTSQRSVEHSISPRRYTFANGTSSSATASSSSYSLSNPPPISPSRYSSLNHPLSPRSLLPISAASSANPSLTSSPSVSSPTGSARTSSYAHFISSLSPRGSSTPTSLRTGAFDRSDSAAAPARFSSPSAQNADSDEDYSNDTFESPSSYSALHSSTYKSNPDRTTGVSTQPSSGSSASSYSTRADLFRAPLLPSSTLSTTGSSSSLKSAPSFNTTTTTNSSLLRNKSVPLSGSNLAATLPTKRVTFENGVGETNISSNQSRPTVSKPPIDPQPTNFSLIQAAKAKAMELDAIDSQGGTTFNGSRRYSSSVSSFGASSPLDSSFDSDPVDSFDRQLELLLTKSSQSGVTKISRSRPTSATVKQTSQISSSHGHDFDQSEMESARSELSVTPANPTSTWSSQHAQPSVALAAARAARRESATKK